MRQKKKVNIEIICTVTRKIKNHERFFEGKTSELSVISNIVVIMFI